uniref:Odorant receptor 58 n=1 Tax=Athetis dissimilis TaxID=1737331 RepID=A0A0S1TQ17_ATHDI|nr:odorant receptor 58 [Athetis dissimilis]
MRGAAARCYHVFALTATSVYVLLQLIYAYQERSDMDKLSQVMFVMLCHVTCVAKQIAFYVDAERIDELIAGLDDPLMNQTAGARGALLHNCARAAARLLRTYSGCAVATCVLWIVFPVLYRIQGVPFEFPFWIGVDYDNNAVFGVVLLYSFYCTNLVAIGNTTMDAFMATILDQCKTQLRIVRMNFETLPERARAAHIAAGAQYESEYECALHALFKDCLVHYNNVSE